MSLVHGVLDGRPLLLQDVLKDRPLSYDHSALGLYLMNVRVLSAFKCFEPSTLRIVHSENRPL